jgi:hypothetical protein
MQWNLYRRYETACYHFGLIPGVAVIAYAARFFATYVLGMPQLGRWLVPFLFLPLWAFSLSEFMQSGPPGPPRPMHNRVLITVLLLCLDTAAFLLVWNSRA